MNVPAVMLFFLPAITVELLSGNTKLEQYFTLPVFILMNVLYGGAALLIREVTVKWQKGILSMMLLGVAYGMVNEGLVSKGFFDPHFYAVTAFGLENVGRFFGFNIGWALCITAIHIIFSIIVPILLISSLFPDNKRWLGERSFYILLMIFIGDILLFEKINRSYSPSSESWALLNALIIIFILAAKFVPDFPIQKFKKAPPHAVVFVFGALFAYLLFFVAIGLHKYIPILLVEFIALATLMIVFFGFLSKIQDHERKSRVTLVAGLLTPQILTSVASGRLVIPSLITVLLIIIWTKTKPALS